MAVSVSAAKLKKTDRGAKRNPAHKKVLIVFLIIFIVYSSILAFPFLWMIFNSFKDKTEFFHSQWTVSYTHLRAHETPEHLVCRLLLEKKK